MNDDLPGRGLLYSIDDRPPFPRGVVLALQHVLTMFGATVAVPLLLGASMGMDQPRIAVLISSVMLSGGVATLVQSTIGSRLPIIQGMSFSFLVPFVTIIGVSRSQGLGADEIMPMIAGAIVVGGVFEMIVGLAGWTRWLRRVLRPVVIGPVIMLIGLSLFRQGFPKAATYLPVGAATIVLVLLCALVLAPRIRFFRMFPILSVVVVMFAVCWSLSAVGVFRGATTSDAGEVTEAHPAYVDLDAVRSSPWLRADPREIVFPWGLPRFSAAFIVAALAGYLASIIESYGDYHACCYMSGAGDPTPSQLSRGIAAEGFGCVLAGVLGGFATTSYSENIGLIGITKVASRRVIQWSGVLLILFGVTGKVGALAAAIPGPVVGGLYCVLFGLIAAVGAQQLAKADLADDRTLMIAGFSLFMGLSVPAYFDGSSGHLPGPDVWLRHLPDWSATMIRTVGGTSMAVAAICGLVLDNLVPRSEIENSELKIEN